VQFVIHGVVLAALYEGGPEVFLGGRLAVADGREAGLLQVDVQFLHLIRVGVMIPCPKHHRIQASHIYTFYPYQKIAALAIWILHLISEV